MKILHCCLAAFYIDNYGYQENILTKMHKLQGHEVMILASTETYINNNELGYVEPRSYINEHGIPVTRVPYAKWIPHKIGKKLRIYKGITNILKSFEPEVIFLHDCQFISINEIALYVKKNKNIKVYVDGHTDFINSARNWVSKNILHGIIYRYCAKIIEPYTVKFYGVLPTRVDFLKDMYKIPSEKIELLVMGVDDSEIDFVHRSETRKTIRETLNIANDDFVIVTGGKIDERKKIHILMRAVIELNQKNVKLIVFGVPNEKMKNEILELSEHLSIKYVGWIHPEKVYDYYFTSDLAFFPGTHSVLWEQAVGLGLPAVFKKWDGIQHIDLDGNCEFIETDDIKEIKKTITSIINNQQKYISMKKSAIDKGMEHFSYSMIAKKAIGL